LVALPDEALLVMLGWLMYRDVGRLACVCRGLRDLIAGDTLGDLHWRQLQLSNRRHPPHMVDGSWRNAFVASLQLDGE
jgi:hypothetical protein